MMFRGIGRFIFDFPGLEYALRTRIIVDRCADVMSRGNRDVERIAHDMDRAGGPFEADRRIATIHEQRVVRLDEDQPVGRICDLLVHGMRAGFAINGPEEIMQKGADGGVCPILG